MAEGQRLLTPYIPYKLVVDMTSGAFAGLCSTIITNPIDVVKTKMQGLNSKAKYGGVMGSFQAVFKEQGAIGFLSGV